MSTAAHRDFARRIADQVGRTERAFLRATGEDWLETYARSWAIEEDVYNFVLTPHDRPAVHLPARMITKRGFTYAI